MKLPSTIRFADEKLHKAFYKMTRADELFRHINNAMDDLEENVFCGVRIPKRLIPKGIFANIKLGICGNITYLKAEDYYIPFFLKKKL